MSLSLVHPDDDPPPFRGGLMKVRCEKLLQDAHLRAARDLKRKPTAFLRIASGEHATWRYQLRRIRELVEAGLSADEIREIARAYGQVIDLLCEARDRQRGVVRGEQPRERAA